MGPPPNEIIVPGVDPRAAQRKWENEGIEIIIDPSTRNRNPITGLSVQAEYAEHGIICLNGNNEVLAGINRVSEYFNSNRLYICSNCTNLIDELHAYKWDDKAMDKHQTEKPVKANDHACVVGETLVQTPKGDAAIKDIRIGDIVYSYDLSTGKAVERKVVDWALTRHNTKILEVEFDNGRTFRATPDHKILTGNGWKMLQDLTVGDVVVPLKVKSIKPVGSADVYNITVEGEHNYIIGELGIVSKNCDALRYLVMSRPQVPKEKRISTYSETAEIWKSVMKPKKKQSIDYLGEV